MRFSTNTVIGLVAATAFGWSGAAATGERSLKMKGGKIGMFVVGQNDGDSPTFKL